MPKTQRTIKLAGVIGSDNIPAKTHQAEYIRVFADADNKFNIRKMTDGNVQLGTKKGCYTLAKHPSIENLFTGICNGVKCHFTKKKIVGKLVYWA